VLVVCCIAGFRPEHASTLPLAMLFMALIASSLRPWHRDRLDAAEHAGLSADHELPGDADLLSCRARCFRSTTFRPRWRLSRNSIR
jgi:hypothetical protein